jgi:peptidoglycan/LPS O-acetylase OafA/YrhL
MSVPSVSASSERLHGLDALRGAALLLGIVLHGCLAFFPTQVWLVADDQRSAWASGLFFVIHLFRMTSFFLIAGLFAELMLQRKGVKAFLKNRAARIASPLLVFWWLAMAGLIAAMVLSAQMQGLLKPGATPPPAPPMTLATFPLTHLWFLYMLLLLYAGRLMAGALWQRLGARGQRLDDRLATLVTGPAGPLLMGAVLGASFYLQDVWLAFFGIPTPDRGFIPTAPALIGFGLAYACGALLAGRRSLLDRIARQLPLHLGLALVAGTAAFVLAGGSTPLLAPIADDGLRAVAAVSYGVGTFAATFSVLGLALRWCSGFSAVRRYLADASYWIYIVHLPLVLLAQAAMQDLGWPWWCKLVAVVTSVSVIGLGSYALLVRHTLLGRWLNGRRVPWRANPSPVGDAIAAH